MICDAQSTMPLYGAGCPGTTSMVWIRTLIVSSGCPTKTCAPAAPPASCSEHLEPPTGGRGGGRAGGRAGAQAGKDPHQAHAPHAAAQERLERRRLLRRGLSHGCE